MDISTPAPSPATHRPDHSPRPPVRGRWVPAAAALVWLLSAGAALVVTLTGHALPVGDRGGDWHGMWSHLPAPMLTPWAAALAVAGAMLALWTW